MLTSTSKPNGSVQKFILALSMLFACVAISRVSAETETYHHLFETSDHCMACHNGLITPAGEDVSIGANWSASMMANAARDPYWQAAIRRETMDHPEATAAIEHECATCHMPMARFEAKAEGREQQVFAQFPGAPTANSDEALLARDGVSCSLCHQIMSDNLGTADSYVGGFHVNTNLALGNRTVYGPFNIDEGRQEIMRSAAGFKPQEGVHVKSSALCASCHTLITEALGNAGSVIGKLYEQMPYQEWQHSSFANEKSCQDCHMPVVEGAMPVAAVLGQAREGFMRHDFRGGNFFIQRMLNRYRNELAVTASSQALETAAQRTVEHLQSGLAGTIVVDSVQVAGAVLTADITVSNNGGHKLPTAYPSRRLWIQFTVQDSSGSVVFESGKFNADGAITGNDNDADAFSYEPHYEVITSPDQVQIYEAIVAGSDEKITTGLLTATHYLKDNRLLPRGFDKQTADPTIGVVGTALADSSFKGGSDHLSYRIPTGTAKGPFKVDAKLWYQPVGYRWATNLAAYDAPEPRRFGEYYRAMSSASALIMGETTAVAE